MSRTGSEPGWLLRSYEWKRRTRSSSLRQALEEAGAALMDADLNHPLDADIASTTTLPIPTPSRERWDDERASSPQRSKSKTTSSSVFVTAAQQSCLDTSSSRSRSRSRAGSAPAPTGNGTLRSPKEGGGSKTSRQASDRLPVSSPRGGGDGGGGGSVRPPTSDALNPEQEFAIHRFGEAPRQPRQGTEGSILPSDDGRSRADGNEGRRGDDRLSEVPRRPPQGTERCGLPFSEGGGDRADGNGGCNGNERVSEDTGAVTIELDDTDEDFPCLIEQELVRRKRRRRAVNEITSALFLSASCSADRNTPPLAATTTRTAQARGVCGALSRLELSHISLESSGDWAGQPEPTDSWEPAPVDANSVPSLEDTPSEENAAALVARLQQTYGDGLLAGLDGMCTKPREQTRQLNEIPHLEHGQAAQIINLGDYRCGNNYGNKADTAEGCRTRGRSPDVGCAGCWCKAGGRVNDGTTAGDATDCAPCERRYHVGMGHLGGEQTDGTTAVPGVDSEGVCWEYRPSGANRVKSGGTFFGVAYADGDRTPSPLPSPPAPQISTKRRGTSKLRQPLAGDHHHAASSSLLLHEHQHAGLPQRVPRPGREQSGGGTAYNRSDNGTDPVATAVCLDETESVMRLRVEESVQPMSATTVRYQPLHQGNPTSPGDDISPKKQCEGPVGTLLLRRLQDEGGKGQALQSTTKCSPQHSQQNQAFTTSANVCASAALGALSPSSKEDAGRSSATQDDERQKAKISYRKEKSCYYGGAGSGNQSDMAATLPLAQEAPWVSSAVGSKPGEPTDCAANISRRPAANERLLFREEAAATGVDEDEKPTVAAPAAFVVLVQHECNQSVPNEQDGPAEHAQESEADDARVCEVGGRRCYAADTAGALSASNTVQEEEGGDFGPKQIAPGIAFLMHGTTGDGGDCTGRDDNEPQQQQQQYASKTWAIEVIRQWLLRSIRRRQRSTGRGMGTRLTGGHVATIPVEGEFDAAQDGGMHPAVGRISRAVAPPSMHLQSTVSLARTTDEQDAAADTLLPGAPRSVASCQASCGVKISSPALGSEQPPKGAVPAYSGGRVGHPEAASVTAASSTGRRRSSPARVGHWPSQDSPTTPTGRSLSFDQEVDQAHRVFCHPTPTSPKLERAQSSGGPLGADADGRRGGYAWPCEAFTTARPCGLVTGAAAAASLSAALPFGAAPPPSGHVASLPPAGDEVGEEVQGGGGSSRRQDQGGGNVWDGTGIRTVGDAKRGVSFCEGLEHPAVAAGQRRPISPPPPCHLTKHCRPHRRFGQPPDWSFRNNSVGPAVSMGVGVPENARGRPGFVRQAGSPNSGRNGGVWGGAGIDTDTTSKPERQGVYPNRRRRSEGVCGGGGVDTGRTSTPEGGACPPRFSVVCATLMPPISPPPHEATTVTLLTGGIGRQRDIAARTFRNPLLEALDVSNPLLGAVTN